ncbi:hypothetical protein [Candidatus Synchoanobacter obligatus]|uniref:Uncharacterized protein n=1 Tax=Candidatus Synchoanobacter obligatus TaxID=2919597 RepID=A0ABT1L5A2_9GAMM|nr:hypothetical protein [Candidatus Synchoanobacter obligatus]MCP8352357.1 hypothetical protein [Candidatus Synchoanobacter obligatus]
MIKFGLRSAFKSLFHVKSWVGWDSLAKNGSFIRQLLNSLFNANAQSAVQETFEEAVSKYGYTPEFLANQEANFQRAARVYLGFFAIGAVYMLWLLIKKKWLASFVMVPINLMMFSFYFRESFWQMQLRRKKLGMTAKEWFHETVLGYDQ